MSYPVLKRSLHFIYFVTFVIALLMLAPRQVSAQSCTSSHGVGNYWRDCDCDGFVDTYWSRCITAGVRCDGCNDSLCDYCCPLECAPVGELCSGCCCVASNGAPCDPKKGTRKLLPAQENAFKPVKNFGPQKQRQRKDRKKRRCEETCGRKPSAFLGEERARRSVVMQTKKNMTTVLCLRVAMATVAWAYPVRISAPDQQYAHMSRTSIIPVQLPFQRPFSVSNRAPGPNGSLYVQVEWQVESGFRSVVLEVQPDGSVVASYDLNKAGTDTGEISGFTDERFAVDSSGSVYFVKSPLPKEQKEGQNSFPYPALALRLGFATKLNANAA